MKSRATRWLSCLAGLVLAGAAHAATLPAPGQQVALPQLAAAAGMSPSRMQGKVIVIAWFASWCPFCMHEAPQLQRLYADNLDRMVVVGVSVEKGDPGQAAKVKQWIARFGWTFPVVLDGTALERVAGKPKGIPSLVVLGRNGVVHQVESGEMLDEDFEDIAAFARREVP